MRVIAGYLGGRQFNAPKGHRTHPMSEKARGGLFNSLGDLTGFVILDAFAGSGALSIEAVSRGAKSVVAIDIDKRANMAIKENINKLEIDNIQAIKANVSGWSDKNTNLMFDIVIAAPPYDGIKIPLLHKIVKHVKPDGLYILDWPKGLEVPAFEGLNKLEIKNYGDAQLVFYKKTG